jgi:hypothetical protein
MVFDENETDSLSSVPPEKESLTNYYSDLLKNQDYNNNDFYERKAYHQFES